MSIGRSHLRGMIEAWLYALLVCLAWIAVIRPWRSGATPLRVVFASLFASLMLVGIRRARERKGDGESKLFDDLILAFLIMAATGLFYWFVGLVLDGAGRIEGSATLEAVRAVQAGSDWFATSVNGLKLLFWLSLLVGIAAGLLLLVGAVKVFDRLIAAHKPVRRMARTAVLSAICIGSFSLAGQAAAGTLVEARRAAAFQFSMTAKREQAFIEREAVRRIAAEVTAQLLRPESGQSRSFCEGGNVGDPECDPMPLMRKQLEIARAYSELWPKSPERFGLPADPLASEPVQQVRAGLDAVEALRAPQVTTAEPSDPELGNATLHSIRQAGVALSTAPPRGDYGTGLRIVVPTIDPAVTDRENRKRLGQLIDIAISSVMQQYDVGLTPAVIKTGLGGFVSKTAGAVSGRAQAKLEELTRELILYAVTACRGGMRACGEATRRKLAGLGNDSRMIEAVQGVRQAVGPELTQMRALARVSVLQNAVAAERYEAALDVMVRSEGEGPWGELRSRWTRDLLAGSVDDLTPHQKEGWTEFAREWQRIRREQAVGLLREGRAGTARDWNLAFLAHLRESPASAAIFGYWVVNDDPIRPYLLDRYSGQANPEIWVLDGFTMFASDTLGTPWGPDDATPDGKSMLNEAFAEAYETYCPKRKTIS